MAKRKAGKADTADKAPKRSTMRALLKKHIKSEDPRWIMSSEELDWFRFNALFTGLIDVDLVVRPNFGKRITFIGDRSVGKSVLTYIFEGAAHHTCRHCATPIIPWVNEKTGEIKEACRCRANEPMVVIHVDAEDSFDPPWAARWGPHTQLELDKNKRLVNKDCTFWVMLAREGEEVFDFTYEALRSGAADFVAIDSIAVMLPHEVFETKDKDGKVKEVGVGQERVSPRARLMASGLTKCLNGQINGKLTHKAYPTILWTNQFYMGPARPHTDPRHPSGGVKAGYLADHEIRIKARAFAHENDDGKIEGAYKFLNVDFVSTKGKSGGTAGGTGHYRLILDTMKTKNGFLHAGDTDEPERLVAYLEQVGLFSKGKKS
jgi:hypothetical protein